VSQYTFYVSQDGKQWGSPVAEGEFGNIKANPIQQKVPFTTPVKVRYFKFVALGSADGDCINVAELGLMDK
jgi:alpha-L-fucosidase